MLTIEKFYFNHKDASGYITVSCDATDCQLEFVGEDSSPINVRITMRGRDNFRLLIEQIHSMAIGLLESANKRDAEKRAAEQGEIG